MENSSEAILLRDSGYPLKNYLTPLLHPNSSSELRYNRSPKATRVTVEQLNGIWKSRFLCLSHKVTGPIQFTPERCCMIIYATAILHNMPRDLQLCDHEFDVEELTDNDEIFFSQTSSHNNQAMRRYMIENYFN